MIITGFNKKHMQVEGVKWQINIIESNVKSDGF